MDAFSLNLTLIDGLAFSLALGAVIFSSFFINVRIWLQDFPAEVRAVVPPLSSHEKRQQYFFGAWLLIFMVAGLWLSAQHLKAVNGGTVPFVSMFLHLYLVFTMFNLFDLLVIDYFIGAVLKPKWSVIAGAEHLAYLHQNLSYHLKGFWKALIVSAVFSLPIAALSML